MEFEISTHLKEITTFTLDIHFNTVYGRDGKKSPICAYLPEFKRPLNTPLSAETLFVNVVINGQK